MQASDEDSVVQYPRWKTRKRLTRKEKGKKKTSEHNNLEGTSDQSESDKTMSEDGPPEPRSESANERLRRSIHQKNLVIRYGYNEYMAHHYVYMANVEDVCELESYAEMVKDANWRATMEEEVRALAKKRHGTWLALPRVYKVKYNVDSFVNRYKARMVAKGYAQ